MIGAQVPDWLWQEMRLDPLALHLADSEDEVLRPPGDGALAEALATVRRNVAVDLGLVLPPVRVRADPALGQGRYRLVVDGLTVSEGLAPSGHVMVADPDEDRAEATDPLFGLPVRWVLRDGADPDDRAVPRERLLASHVEQVAREHAPALLTREAVAELVDSLRREHPSTTEEVDGGLLPLPTLHAVLRAMLAEGRSIRNLRRLLEALGAAQIEMAPLDQLLDSARAVSPLVGSR